MLETGFRVWAGNTDITSRIRLAHRITGESASVQFTTPSTGRRRTVVPADLTPTPADHPTRTDQPVPDMGFTGTQQECAPRKSRSPRRQATRRRSARARRPMPDSKPTTHQRSRIGRPECWKSTSDRLVNSAPQRLPFVNDVRFADCEKYWSNRERVVRRSGVMAHSAGPGAGR